MKKKLLLLIIILFLTGCDATYYAEIKNGKVYESTNFYVSNLDSVENNADLFENPNGPSKSADELVEDYYNQDYLAYYNRSSSNQYYKKEKISYEDRNGVRLSYTYSLKDYQDSSLLHYCFDTVSVENQKGFYTIDLKDSEKCFTQDVYQLLDSVNIQIVSNEVIEHNADSVNGSIYTWVLTKDNPNQEIHFKIKADSSFLSSTEIVILIILVFGIISFIAVYKVMDYMDKKKKR